jgi:hypothetical protein
MSLRQDCCVRGVLLELALCAGVEAPVLLQFIQHCAGVEAPGLLQLIQHCLAESMVRVLLGLKPALHAIE